MARGARCGFCTGCFTGDYPVDIGDSHTKAQFENSLSGDVETF